jgi:Transmembrane domain of unknown function (DUF3566)
VIARTDTFTLMKRTLKRIEPLQLGKMFGLLQGGMSLIFAPVFLIFGLVGALVPHSKEFSPQMAAGPILMIIMAIAIPVIYAIIGFIVGIIMAFLYNLIAKVVGGVQVEVE